MDAAARKFIPAYFGSVICGTAGCTLLRCYGNLFINGQAGVNNGVEWPVAMLGIVPSVLIALGFLPQYYELYGISIS